MNKEIQKNREALIRYFYTLPEINRNITSSYIFDSCLCAKGQTMKMFYGIVDGEVNKEFDYCSWKCAESEIEDLLGLPPKKWHEMEMRFEGGSKYKQHKFSEIADWLQTLPGWPKVL